MKKLKFKHISKRKFSLWTLIVASLLGTNAVYAQNNLSLDVQPRFYGGLGIGQARTEGDTRVLGATSVSNDEKETAYKAYLGYQINNHFALEGGYYNLGRFDYSANTPSGNINGSGRYDGISLDLVGQYPLSQKFALLGSVGAHYSRNNVRYNGGTTGIANPYSSNHDLNYKYGVGAQYKINDGIYMRALAERYHFKDPVATDDNVNMYSLNLVIPFGGRAAKPLPQLAQAPIVVEKPVVVERPVEKTVVVQAPRKITLSADSLFGFDKHEVSPAGQQVLDKLVQDLQRTQIESILVTGYADRIGSHDYNLNLSRQRAQSVRDYLVKKMGISETKITAVGKDGENPVTGSECKGSKPTKELIACLQPDRRVVVEVTATEGTR